MNPLHTLDDLDQMLTNSAGGAVLLFKHRETCGMSAQARFEIEAVLLDRCWRTPVHLVSVQSARAVSNAVVDRLRTPHASPQLLLVRDRTLLWQASHLAITEAAIRRAVTRVLDALPGAKAS